MSASPSAFVVANKPPGVTSRYVVDRVARLVRPAKAGHAGTLDPLASGVLVIGIGQATRLVEYVQRMRKQYRARFLLGRTSASDDTESPPQMLPSAAVPTLGELRTGCAAMIGLCMQRPPAYSAVKQQGRRAYALARAGHDVQLAARPVWIYALEVMRYDWPELDLEIECGSGTYVRSIGRDLAAALGTGAVMSALERTRIGTFANTDAAPLEALDAARLPGLLVPLAAAVADLPALSVTADAALRLRRGQALEQAAGVADQEWAVFHEGNLVAIVRGDAAGRLRPIKVVG